MKNLFRFIIKKILTSKARNFLKKNNIQVIAITGSIGKTTVKEAVYHILKNQFKIYKSPQGFNTEIGISLAILQETRSGFSSAKAWLKILKRIFLNKKEKFQKIILEMGADKSGDIKKLIKIAKPKIGIITNINPVHLGEGQFKDLEDIRKEKNTLIKNMQKDSVAILNYDDPLVKNMETGGEKVSYGIENKADVRASEIAATGTNIRFKTTYKGETVEFEVPLLGEFQIYTLMPAIAVALKLGIDLHECAKALEDFSLPPSRMNPLTGINDSSIIDSSYNASPTSMAKALELLGELKAGRKIAALGTMNELGDMSKEAHLNLGALAAKTADVLVAVGPEAATIKQGAVENGMQEDNIYTFFDSEEAGHFLKNHLKAKDLILVKGSQNKVRMEKFVKIIMAEPEKAKKLLCRQDNAWEKI